ncbi:MAG: hypothetical protein GX614_01405 [Sandaracinaceae bacterium]|nr:hypothetical protein [Sandaracinaceae bacterium]
MVEPRADERDAPRWWRALGFLIASALIAAAIAGLLWAFDRYGWYAGLIVVFIALYYPPLTFVLFPGVWIRRADPPPRAEEDLERRRPVWLALSALYLDTELGEDDHARIAEALRESGYSAEELEEILYRELHPVLCMNLISVAGEWAGFDMEWVEEEILRRRRREARVAIVFGKWLVSNEWSQLKERIEAR